MSNEKPWYYDIKHFLQTHKYLVGTSNKDIKTLRRLAGSFFLSENVLYKRNYDMVLLRCVYRHEECTLMHEIHESSFGTHANEIHEGSFSTHANGHSMENNMFRECYYWLTMESDC